MRLAELLTREYSLQAVSGNVVSRYAPRDPNILEDFMPSRLHRPLVVGAVALALLVSGCRPERLTSSARVPVPDAQRVAMGSRTDVLYVLDGHVLARAATDSAGMPTAIRSLDPSHIVSIQVLKGAKARKQYGEAGASGVVVITTSKSGR